MQKKIIVALVVVIFLGAVWFLSWSGRSSKQPRVSIPSVEQNSQTADNATRPTGSAIDTSNWNLYSNERYGFELQYPKYWIKNNYSAGDTRSALEYKGASIVLENFGHGLPFDWEEEKTAIVIDGKQFAVATYTKDGRVVGKIITVPTKIKNKEGQKMTIQVELAGIIDESIINDFDKIFSTFKFID